ncbi:hypothetical protein HPB47_001205 [Ixodes persulcatus]|uniref:Uncharacterized protein n=1 Tax=Ixodes persulcatus TaxID=34615 RepID=A0AC60PR42_IXOPE|nr:hypothetical protein HPB47_001205 [Ixodes persulcatus]
MSPGRLPLAEDTEARRSRRMRGQSPELGLLPDRPKPKKMAMANQAQTPAAPAVLLPAEQAASVNGDDSICKNCFAMFKRDLQDFVKEQRRLSVSDAAVEEEQSMIEGVKKVISAANDGDKGDPDLTYGRAEEWHVG